MADLRELNLVVVNSIHSGLMTADLAGRVLHLNEFGELDPGTRGRARCAACRCASCSTRCCWSRPRCNARAAHRGLARLDVPYQHPDGGPRDLGVSVSPLATAEPGRRGYLLVFQDLTEIRRRDREVRLREKLAAVGEMAAHLAHEIRNPLGSISGSAQVLMSEAQHVVRAGAAARHHHARVEAPVGHAQPVPVPGAADAQRGARWTWAA